VCFSSYEVALQKLRRVLASGETNVDIGAAQINWRANGWRLPDPALLLEVRNNIMVEAEILSENRRRCGGDLPCAIARYYSPDRTLGARYQASVLDMVSRLRLVPGLLQSLAE
jgi:hypothetical protein